MPPDPVRRFSGIAATSHSCSIVKISDLPEHLLQRIVFGATGNDDLIRHVAACAVVCRHWNAIARRSPAWGEGMSGWRNHTLDVLRGVVRCVRTGSEEFDIAVGTLSLHGISESETWTEDSDIGCCVLGAALQALPRPLKITRIDLRACSLTPVGIGHIAAALTQQDLADLVDLRVSENPNLGNAGVVRAMAMPLPATLRRLEVCTADISDAGLAAIASALPKLIGLRRLSCRGRKSAVQHLPGPTDQGWLSLWEVLPQLPALTQLDANDCAMSPEAALALVASASRCSTLCTLCRNRSYREDTRVQEAEEQAMKDSPNFLSIEDFYDDDDDLGGGC
jgi:hypothetical protein